MLPVTTTLLTISIIIVPFSLIGCYANSSGIRANVISVSDGDTLQVTQYGKTITVRLACIDAPETGQRRGKAAAKRLDQLLPSGTNINLRLVTKDRYGRQVAEIYRNNGLINLQMVAEGEAVVYEAYLDSCNAQQYREAQRKAKQSKLGFWTVQNPIMPWPYRQGKRPNITTTIPQNLPSCISRDCNCSHFSTQAEAQQVLNAFSGDPHRLDGDHDNLACESLP